MTKVLATYNIKGGVGKTSAAVNLSYLAAHGGSRTLLWDLDPQGAATYLFRVKPKVDGGASKLVRLKTDPAGLIKGTDYRLLDLLPADFSYRHMDLALDNVKPVGACARRRARPAPRRLRLHLPGLPAEHLAGVRERVPRPPTRCWCRSSRRCCPRARSTSCRRSSRDRRCWPSSRWSRCASPITGR